MIVNSGTAAGRDHPARGGRGRRGGRTDTVRRERADAERHGRADAGRDTR
ncbi:hypothetical protein ACWDR1_28625 [Streptosporangium sandarakinum]